MYGGPISGGVSSHSSGPTRSDTVTAFMRERVTDREKGKRLMLKVGEAVI